MCLKTNPSKYRGQKAINEYSKAVGDAKGEAELMTYFVECGNQFTVEFGDIDEGFYDALLRMYARAIDKSSAFSTKSSTNFERDSEQSW
jgi:hypothetical protein